MIGYVTLGTNDLEKSTAFYDSLLAEIGAKRTMEGETFVAWGTGPTAPGIGVIKPYDGNEATVGNGMMVAIACDNPEAVDKLYKKALELGGTCEGPTGPRGGGFYAGYFRDLDGNKLNAFCMTGDA
ncbi:MAG: VOC family protein [Pseudomonadota bacterium]